MFFSTSIPYTITINRGDFPSMIDAVVITFAAFFSKLPGMRRERPSDDQSKSSAEDSVCKMPFGVFSLDPFELLATSSRSWESTWRVSRTVRSFRTFAFPAVRSFKLKDCMTVSSVFRRTKM